MKKRNPSYYLVTLPLLLLACVAGAQNASEVISKAFDNYGKNNLEEKLFVHTDKAFYMAGELIWFKVYAVDAHLNRPLALSKVVYVELLSRENKTILQVKIAMNEEGCGNGSFQLPYSVGSGTFVLRAYTNWMKNQSAEYFFEKEITIINGLKEPDWPVAQKPGFDIQFFPEGGALVNGIQSKVAFKFTDMQGKAVNGVGALLNRRNDTIVKFSTLRFGMGNFEFVPDAGENYHAVVFINRIINSAKIPDIETSGYVMQLTELDKDRLKLKIQSKNVGPLISVLVHTRNVIKYSFSAELSGGQTEIEVDKNKLGEGISHFTVFNDKNQPVCERLYFKKPASLIVSAKTNLPQYGQRKKVTIDIDTHNEKQVPIESGLSMSVFQLDSLQSIESINIQNYIWLSSDLKGKIESPDYYFSGKDGDVVLEADNLMLAQGWRRFKWVTVLEKPVAEKEWLAETEGHIIQGKMINKRNGQFAENITAFLSVPAERSLFTTTLSDKNGTLRFNMMNFYGGNEVTVQTNSLVDSNYRIDIGNPFSEKYSNNKLNSFSVSDKQAANILAHSISSQIGNAFYSDKQQHFLYPEKIDSTPFYGMPDKRYYLDDYTRFVTMEEVMREFVSEVGVSKNKGHFSFHVWNEPYKKYFSLEPLVLIDGVPVFDVDKIISFDPLKIKKLDVMTHRFYQHNQVQEGVVNFSTYQGDLAGYPLDANALIVEYEGLQLQREFYSPKYETAVAESSRLPDFRNLLYWAPEIHTGKDGKQQLSFYTGDLPGKYAVVIQGITANGLAGAMNTTFTVQ